MKNLINKDKDLELSKCLKALSHPVRLAIVRMLLERSSCPCGCNPCSCGEECEGKNCKCGCKCGTLVDQFDISQSTVSQHIKELKKAGLIELKNRKGDYTLNHNKFMETLELFNDLCKMPSYEIKEDKKCKCCG